MSSRHWKVEFVSVAENVNEIAPATRAGGVLSIVVFGAMVSTVQPRVAGVASVLPAASVAFTAKVCAPCASPG